MGKKKQETGRIYARWLAIRIVLVLYDILAVNAASVIALLTRFYVAREFHSAAAPYFAAYGRYAPYYTAFCLIVFACFRLYSGMWRYAGFNDLNRIAAANLLCLIGHVAGTLLFVRRMPVSFYCLGAFLQLCLITASRFSYRLLLLEKHKVACGRRAAINAMVVGTGGTGKAVLQELERKTAVRPVCALSCREAGFGTLLDGVPVVSGVENLRSAMEKYRVNLVIIASTVMPQQIRDTIKAVCAQAQVEVQDYSGFFQSVGSGLTLKTLAQYAVGTVELVIHGEHRQYPDCTQALLDTAGRYVVKTVSAKADTLVIELTDPGVVQNDLNADWVRDQEKETGESISFF